MTILNIPGVYPGVPMAHYLAAPAVSAGMLDEIETKCPRAAWHKSWLNPHFNASASTKAQNVGTIAHQIFLEGKNDCCVIVDPADHPNEKGEGIPVGWTNKAIKIARDTILAEGKIPILKDDYPSIEAMVTAMRAFVETLKDKQPAIYAALQPGGGDSELTVIWDDAGTLCRMRPDRISTDRAVMVDVKTTLASAEPNAWGRRQVFPGGFDVGAAHYCEGANKAFGTHPTYVWLVCEQAEPHLCSLVSLAPVGRALAEGKWRRGMADWKSCAKSGVFPAYPNDVVYVEPPAWERVEFEAEERPEPDDTAKAHAYFDQFENGPPL